MPPGRFGLRTIAADDLILTILWTLVIAGLVLLGLLAASTLFGSDTRLTGNAEATVDFNPNSGTDNLSPNAQDAQAAATQATPDQQTSGADQHQDPMAGASNSAADQVAACPVVASVASPPSPSEHVAGGLREDVSASVGVNIGKVLESNIHSRILNRDLPYRVYLPPGYDDSSNHYPVLYMLHGNGTGLWTEWTSDNRLGVIADALISTGKIQPMIIMMPDGEHSYFMNGYQGDRWQDYVMDEVIPFTDSNYRTIADREHRAIGGHSMGGQAALTMAFLYPSMFVAVGAHSPSLHWSSEGSPEFFGPDWYFAMYNPLELSKTAPDLNTLKTWADYGDQDPWLPAGAILDPNLTSHGVAHQWHIYPGYHYTTYWIEHGQEYLEFYSSSFGSGTSGAAQQPC
jgi:enterochelin esterase-like enzyme